MKGFPPNHLFLKTPVRNVSNDNIGRVLLHLENGKTEAYDHVILATHGDQALSILGASATEQERSILSCFQTSQNEAVLHSDLSLMPRRKRTWSGWNFLTMSSPSTQKANMDKVCITYNMNILQRIPRNPFGDVLVTLNPIHRPTPSKIQGRYFYTHPLHNASTVRAQRMLRYIQNRRGISYAGAWTGYGFHEDGFTSGLQVAQDHLGAKLPFEFRDSTYSRGRVPRLGLLDHLLRLLILAFQVFIIQMLERLAQLAQSGRQRVMQPFRGGFKKKQPRKKLA